MVISNVPFAEEAARCIILCIPMFHVLVWRGMDRKAYQSLKITLFCFRVSLPTNTNTYARTLIVIAHQLQAGPLDLSFWSFLTFFAPWYRRSIEASSVKTSQKNSKQKLVKCATEVARLRKVSIQSCTQNWPSPKIQWGPCAYVIIYGNLPPSQSFCGYCWVTSQNGFYWTLESMM